MKNNQKDTPNIQKTLRTLSLYERLNRGEVLQKKDEAERFSVDERTIQRDIQDLKIYLAENYGHDREANIEYSRKEKGYVIKRSSNSWLTHHEILVIAKVLLESRAFNKEELDSLLDKLVRQSEPSERKPIKEVIQNERFHYVPVGHKQDLSQKIWDLSRAVREQWLVELTYQKEGEKIPGKRMVEARGVIFSEFYFYLIANIHGKNYPFPAIYRLDRIQNYAVTNIPFSILKAARFEEGEFRKHIQFMKAGPLTRIQFRFWGDSLEAVLDRLPTARVIKQEGNVAVVEAEVFGNGIKMWLLSQAECLEVIYPPDLREVMRKTIASMAENYIFNVPNDNLE